MSKKHDYQLKKWQCLIKEYQDSGMKLIDWCTVNSVTKYQYFYWLEKVRLKYYEEAVNQLQEEKAINDVTVPALIQKGSFVEIRPDMAREVTKQENFSQPVAVIQKDGIRIEIMSNAPASFITRLLEAARYA